MLLLVALTMPLAASPPTPHVIMLLAGTLFSFRKLIFWYVRSTCETPDI